MVSILKSSNDTFLCVSHYHSRWNTEWTLLLLSVFSMFRMYMTSCPNNNFFFRKLLSEIVTCQSIHLTFTTNHAIIKHYILNWNSPMTSLFAGLFFLYWDWTIIMKAYQFWLFYFIIALWTIWLSRAPYFCLVITVIVL